MSRRVVGLDVGTDRLRAVELSFGKGEPTITCWGQVPLPQGAVVAGEVADPPAVTAALTRLWKECDFRTRTVVVGVSNTRAVARIAELPVMPDDELRSSLRFQAQDLIAIPVDQAVVDHQVLERVTTGEGDETLRVLLVAAHHDMVAALLAAIDGARLTPARIDLDALAVLRALRHAPPAPGDPGEPDEDGDGGAGPEAVVDVGAGVTNVVVHQAGVPRFVRTLAVGSDAVVAAVAAEAGISLDAAADLVRRADALADDPEAAPARRVIAGLMSPLLEDVRGSLDFYDAQGDEPLTRVLLTGSGSRLPDLDVRLAELLGLPIDHATPSAPFEVAGVGLATDVLWAPEQLTAVALGLALAGDPGERGAGGISLLPDEVRTKRRRRRRAVLASAGAVAAVALLLGAWFVRGTQLDAELERAERAEAAVSSVRQEVAALSDVAELQASIALQQQAVTGLLESDVSWSRLLRQVAAVMPDDVWLTSLNGTAGTPGTVNVSGKGKDHTSSARWLLDVAGLESVTELWLPSSVAVPAPGGEELVTFASSATLTDAARSDRAASYTEVQP